MRLNESFCYCSFDRDLKWRTGVELKRAGRTEQEIKQQREKGNTYTAEFKLRLMLNMLDTHEFIEKLQAAGLSRTLQSFPRFLEFY